MTSPPSPFPFREGRGGALEKALMSLELYQQPQTVTLLRAVLIHCTPPLPFGRVQ